MKKSEIVEIVAAELDGDTEAAGKAVDTVFSIISAEQSGKILDPENEIITENKKTAFKTVLQSFTRFVNGLAGPALVFRDMQTRVAKQDSLDPRLFQSRTLSELSKGFMWGPSGSERTKFIKIPGIGEVEITNIPSEGKIEQKQKETRPSEK